MLAQFKKLFSDNKTLTDAEKTTQLQLATAVLMVEVSKSDDEIDSTEVEQIRTILSQKFSMDETTLNEVFTKAKNESDNAISLHEFTREICSNYEHSERITILKHLWQVAFADGKIDQHERHFIRKIAGLLYLTDQDITLARSLAQD